MPAKSSTGNDAQWIQSLQMRGLISPDDVRHVLERQRLTGQPMAALLQSEPVSEKREVAAAIAEWVGLPWITLDQVAIDPEVIRLVPAQLAERYSLLPLRLDHGTLEVALGDLTHEPRLTDMRAVLKHPLRAQLTSLPQWRRAFSQYYGFGAGMVEALKTSGDLFQRKGEAERDAKQADAQLVRQFVDHLISQAYRDDATDLHLDPFRDHVRVRQRIDGVLYDIPVAAGLQKLHGTIVSCLKVMTNLNIAERRLPQDGRCSLRIDGDDVDVRLSTLPTPYGESVDLRLLSTKALYDLKHLGLFQDQLEHLERLLDQPHGILFVTGPTGSGKTTTLYAYLRKLKPSRANIVTIEDPIEQVIDGVTQIQVHTKIDLTFAAGLRSVLRHDPDVIMLGEVRDAETAEIAIRSALTGHLVFSTLHTNDAASGSARLLDMGVEPFLLASSVQCFIAQRLVRLVCAECQQPAMSPTAEVLQQLGVTGKVDTAGLVEGKGCGLCHHTGYRGRTGIFEVIVITDQIRELMMRRASAQELKQVAIGQGMRTLAQAGWEKAIQGLTTISEILRVT